MSTIIKPLTSAELMSGPELREFILLAGKDGVGKSCAIVSLAWMVEQTNPNTTFWVLDTENKFKSALRGFGTDAPKNIRYYQCKTMNEVTENLADVLSKYRSGDWIAVESLSRIWERAQNLGYEAIAGVSKIEYLARKRGEKLPTGIEKKGAPIPNPDDFWAIVKGAHDAAFFDLLTQIDDLNVIVTTTVAKPKQDREGRKENADRKALRAELGIDVGLEGAPRIPYYLETLCMLELNNGRVSCRVLRDNNSAREDSRIEFDVEGRKTWAVDFWKMCR